MPEKLHSPVILSFKSMVGCCVDGCTNSTQKGFIMKRFPSDPERRKAWTVNVNRANWTPTDASRICEVHFKPEMFEQNRADGQRRLRWNSIPTIFSHIPQKKPWKPANKIPRAKIKFESKEKKSVTAVDGISEAPDPAKNSDNAAFCDEEENYIMSESAGIIIKVEPGLVEYVCYEDAPIEDTEDFLAGCCRLKEETEPEYMFQREHSDSIVDIDNSTYIKQEYDSSLHTDIKIKIEPGEGDASQDFVM